jgi:hypothetical protein
MTKYTTKTKRIEVLQDVLNGGSASSILAEETNPSLRGMIGETIYDACICCGVHPTSPMQSVVTVHVNPATRRIESRNPVEYLKTTCIKSGGNKTDVAYVESATGKLSCCTSKIGKDDPTWNELEADRLKADMSAEGGYTYQGKPVTSYSVYALVPSSARLYAHGSHASSLANREGVQILDISDLDRMCAMLRWRATGAATRSLEEMIEFLAKKSKRLPIRARLHQKLLEMKAIALINQGVRRLLLGALPRSGKTFISALVAMGFQRILVLTTRPTETIRQWKNVFNTSREYKDYKVDVFNADTPMLVNGGQKVVAIGSTQYLKLEDRDSMKGLAWDIVLLDEIHEGGATDASDMMLSTYVPESAVQVMLTATYSKPVMYYSIPEEHCLFWDMEDVRLMRSWPESQVRLEEKHGSEFVRSAAKFVHTLGDNDERIRSDYESAPQLETMTPVMHEEVYDRITKLLNKTSSVYGFSMRSLFMPTKDGKAFQNADAVHTFLQIISGANKEEHYPDGDMSILARIQRYWSSIGHRDGDTFMTALCFLPYGIGQYIDTVKDLFANSLARRGSGMEQFATLRLDSGVGGDMAEMVAAEVQKAKLAGKKGILLLTGNVGSLGISLPDVDVAFMMHDMQSADMTYQQMMRVLTEAPGKRCGIVVDFNVWRVLTTMNAYAVSRCGQGSMSSEKRIWWCISNLINVDSDLWNCKETPVPCDKETLVDRLVKEWRKMVSESGATLDSLARMRVDIGEDQTLLNNIASSEGLGTSVGTRIEGDQTPLANGIIVRSEPSSDQQTSVPTETEVDKILTKSVNLNEVLARLIPDIAVLSRYEPDLIVALKTIAADTHISGALDSFMREFYVGKTESSVVITESALMHPFFQSLVRIVGKHQTKLTRAREVYEIVAAEAGTLDNPRALIEYLSKYFKPREVEKKKNGEVFTPISLIIQMFEKVQEVCPDIWTNPSRKFLDPANGIGNFPAIAYHYLMVGLVNVIPDEAERKRHILENMLYMAELNEKNVEVTRRLFDPDGIYKLNLYCGDFRELDTLAEWNVSLFHCIFGNPPYQDQSGNRGSAQMLWVSFVEKSLGLLAPNGILNFIHPGGWRLPGHKLLEPMRSNHIHYLSIHDESDGLKTFSSNTRYDWYVMEKRPATGHTLVECQDGVITEQDITQMPFIPNAEFDMIRKLTEPSQKCTIVNSCLYMHNGKHVEKNKSDTFCYPVVYSVPRSNVPVVHWASSNDRGTFGSPKVIFGSGRTGFYIDKDGSYGLTQWATGVVGPPEELEIIAKVLDSEKFESIIRACAVGKAELNHKVLRLFKESFWRDFM